MAICLTHLTIFLFSLIIPCPAIIQAMLKKGDLQGKSAYPNEFCRTEGQYLPHPHSPCHFLRCRRADGNRNSQEDLKGVLFSVEYACPRGFAVDDSIFPMINNHVLERPCHIKDPRCDSVDQEKPVPASFHMPPVLGFPSYEREVVPTPPPAHSLRTPPGPEARRGPLSRPHHEPPPGSYPIPPPDLPRPNERPMESRGPHPPSPEKPFVTLVNTDGNKIFIPRISRENNEPVLNRNPHHQPEPNMGNDDFRPDHRPPPHFHGDEGPGRFNGPRGPEENQERGMPGEPGPRGMMELNERPVPIDKFNTERGPPYKFSNQDESTARKAGYHGNPNFGQGFPDEEFRPDNGNNMDEKQSGPHDYRERHPEEMQHQENNGPEYGSNNPEMNAPGEPMFQGSQTRTGYHGEDINNRRDHIEDRANENRPPPDKYQQFPDSPEFRPPNLPHNPPRDTIHPEHFQHPKDEPHRHEMPPPDIRDGRMPIGNNNHGIKVHHSPHNENQERGDFEHLEPRQGTGIHDNQRPRGSHRRDNEENIHERNMDMRPPDHIPHRPDFGQMHPAPPGEFRDKPEHIPHMSGPRPPPHPEPHDESRPLKGQGFRPEQSDRFIPDRMMPHDERFHTQEEKFQERHRQHEALHEQENFGVPDRIRERHLENEESPMDIVNENARRGHLSQGQRPQDRHGLPSHHEHHNPNIQARLTPHRKGGPGPSFHNREAARQHQLPGSEGGHSGHPRDGLKPPIPEHGRSDHRIPGDAPDADFQPNRGDNGMRPAFELHHRPEPGHRHPEHQGQLIQNKPRLHLQQQRQQHKNPTEDDKNAAEKERFIKEKFSKAHKQLIFPRQSVPNQRLPPQANNNMQQQFDNRRSHMIPLRPVSREHPIEHHSDLHTARDPMKPMFGRQDRDFHDFFEPKYGKQAEGNHPFKHEDFPKFDLFKNDNNRESMPGGDKHGESGVYAGFLSQLGSTPYPDISHNDKFMNNKPLFHNEADTVTNPPEYYERTKKRAKTDLVEELVRYNSNSQREPMDNNNYQQPEARSASSGASDSKGNPSTDNLGKEYFSVQEPERHHRSKYPMFLTVDTNQYIDGNRRKDGMNNFDMNFGKSGFGSEDYNHLNPPGELSKLDKFLRSGFNEKDPAFQNMNSFGESENQNVPKLFGTSVDEVFGKSSGKSASIWSDVGGAKNYGNDSGFGRLNDSEKRKGRGQKPADGKTKHKARKVKRVQRH